jgi:hypothetical protein
MGMRAALASCRRRCSPFASNEYDAQTREKAVTISKLAANAVVLVERRANGHSAAKKVLAKSGTKSRGISGDFPPGLGGKSDPISGDFPSSDVRFVNSQRRSKASAHFGEK